MMLVAPVQYIEAIDRAELNRLLVRWGHRMGPYERPKYAFEAHHAMFERGEPVAVAAAGETVREVVGHTGIRRAACVELIRLCAARPGLCRPMLRLWRGMLFPAIAAAHGRELAVSTRTRPCTRAISTASTAGCWSAVAVEAAPMRAPADPGAA
jgi:hypothetical protein